MEGEQYERIVTELEWLRNEVKKMARVQKKIFTRIDDPDGAKAAARSANNGFNRPQKITEELRAFLGLPEGEMISRSAVTRRVNAYIKENKLQDAVDGKRVNFDDKLTALLKPPAGEIVTFLNIQKYLSPHYIKDDAAAPAAAPAATETPVAAPEPSKKKPAVAKKKPVVRKPVVVA